MNLSLTHKEKSKYVENLFTQKVETETELEFSCLISTVSSSAVTNTANNDNYFLIN